MKAENTTTLAKSFNKVQIVGVVKENNLELVASTTSDGNDTIRGTLVIKTDVTQEHTVKAYAKRLTSKGNPNPSFNSLEKALHYESIASLSAKGESTDNARVVSIPNSEIRLNTYLSGKKEVVAYPELFFSFIETASVEEANEFKATFDIVGVLESMRPEFKKEVETGRFIISLIAFNYNGQAMPFTFVTTPEAGSYMSVNYQPNKTTKVWGELVSTVVHDVKVTQGFTGAKEEVFDKVEREMVISNGEPIQKEEGIGYDLEMVKKAMAERELYKETLKNATPKGTASPGFTAPNATTATVAKPKW